MGLFSFIKNLFKKQHTELPITIDKAVIEAAKETPLKIVKAPKKEVCLLYTSPSPRDRQKSRMPSSA